MKNEENIFEWDETKNLSNIDKHKLDFDFASKVFSDNNRIEWEDKRNNYGEIRFISLPVRYGDLEENTVYLGTASGFLLSVKE